MKRLLVRRGIKRGIRASGGIRTLVEVSLLLTLDFLAGPWLVNLFCFMRLAKRLIQSFCQIRDFGTIIKK